ncbi:hypothetical protein D4764_09G0004670 [Takifugu flavidus]|uniref:Uncharacterized protein n=1 Tax=Takifugu flavidus TaxID=433684 RepID=A0A5C6MLF4_9TELE|nr:hypothetical protein D4764_09G0004670 [Takifugu flavidus]
MFGNPATRCWGGCWPRPLPGGEREREREREGRGGARGSPTQCVRATCSVLDREIDKSFRRHVGVRSRRGKSPPPAGRSPTSGADRPANAPASRGSERPSTATQLSAAAEVAVGTPAVTAPLTEQRSDRPPPSPRSDGCPPGWVTPPPFPPRGGGERTSALVTTAESRCTGEERSVSPDRSAQNWGAAEVALGPVTIDPYRSPAILDCLPATKPGSPWVPVLPRAPGPQKPAILSLNPNKGVKAAPGEAATLPVPRIWSVRSLRTERAVAPAVARFLRLNDTPSDPTAPHHGSGFCCDL